MNEQNPLPISEKPAEQKTTKMRYTFREGIFALLAFIFAYFFVDTVIDTVTIGIGVTAIVWSFAAFVLIYQLITKTKFTLRGVICLVVLLASSATFTFFRDYYGVSILVFLFDIALGLYWLFITFGASTSERLDYLAWFDALKALVIEPFSCFGHWFGAVFRGIFGKKNSEEEPVEQKKKNRTGLYVFLGIIIAIITSSVVIENLKGDAAFSALFDKLFNWGIDITFGDVILRVLLAFPLGCLLFGALFGATRRQRKSLFTYEGTHKAAGKVRFVPLMIVCIVIFPLLAIYLLYFFSQTAYFVSAFSNILPEGFTYAEYAREGFFELCSVAIINLIVITVSEIFSRYTEKKPALLKVTNTLLSLFALALMVIAQSKVVMYIRTYGMTPKRIFAFWFTIVIGVIFLFIVLYQFLPKINLTRCAVISSVLLLCVIAFANVDAMIAKYNIELSLDTGSKLDATMLTYDLSESAEPVILEYYDKLPDDENKRELTSHFKNRADTILNEDSWYYKEGYASDWRNWNYSHSIADKMIVEMFGDSVKE